jgi:hypothetical protein
MSSCYEFDFIYNGKRLQRKIFSQSEDIFFVFNCLYPNAKIINFKNLKEEEFLWQH